MSELSTQLRDYFDAVVERATAEDVLARSAFDPDPVRAPSWGPKRPRRSALQPALAVAYGFGLTMLVAGAMLAVALLAGELTSGDRASEVGSGAAAAPAGAGVGWVVATGLLIAGTVTATAVALRRRLVDTPKRKEKDMTTIETDRAMQEADGRVRTLERRNRWLVVAVAVLLIAAAALGGILLFGGDSGEAAITSDVAVAAVDSATVDEINALVDEHVRGWSEGDGEAVVATMTDDGFHISAGTDGLPYSGDRLRGFVSSVSAPFDFVWERVSPPIIEADGNGYYVAELERLFSNGTDPVEGDSVLAVIRVVREGGELRIAEYISYEDLDWWRYGASD